jgi:Glycosyltransferase Family 4
VSELDDYDVVFLRYPFGVDLDPLALFRNRSPRVVTVHHTKEPELIREGGMGPANIARMALERINGPRIIARTHGVVGVTDEIRQYELARAQRPLPSTTIPNGIDVEQVNQTGFVPLGHGDLRLVFVASMEAAWHGLDRLLAGLKSWQGPRNVVVDVVGPLGGAPGTQAREGSHGWVNFHGLKTGAALDDIMATATLAVSSLGLHRKQLREACVLKTREYAARGLPFVYAYEDSDLHGDLPFCARLPADNTPIDIAAVERFACSVLPETSRELRAFAEARLDWKHKLRAFSAFAESVSSQ